MSPQSKQKNNKPVIGITLGDLNGIGPEVIIKALNDSRLLNLFTPIVYGSTKALSYYRKMLKANDFNYGQINTTNDISYKRVNVYNCWDEMVDINPGIVDDTVGKYSFIALKQATKDLKEDKIDALVTGPINKHNVQSEEFAFPGHTEYLTQELGGQSLMMMVSEVLKIGVVTGHVALKEVPGKVDKELVASKLKILINTLKNDFNVQKPRIAVLGLNPHAGEEGLLGQEENDSINPVVTEFKKNGELVFGPFPADGFFGESAYQKFDAVLAMYHDQGLIPFKTISFETGVNFTAGISKIRTSPDHGTAYSIAGKGIANESSMREAIYLAVDIIKRKTQNMVEIEV